MKIKFCGLTRPVDIQAANGLRPDYIGFVFAPSRRQVSPEQAAALKAQLHSGIKVVGVFVDAGIPAMVDAATTAGLDVIQLHGSEPEADIPALRDALPGIQVWRALRLRNQSVLAQHQDSSADLLLIDAFAAEAAGGTGKTADWDLLARCRPQRPFLLAGGLHAENIGEAVKKIRPYGLDVSSGIETGGYKDPEKMKTILQLLHSYREGER